MTWQPYALSLAAGLLVGVIYGLLNVRSPAPPIIALLGLLGILLGETVVSHIRGHPGVIAQAFHLKSFAHPPKGAPEPTAAPPSESNPRADA